MHVPFERHSCCPSPMNPRLSSYTGSESAKIPINDGQRINSAVYVEAVK